MRVESFRVADIRFYCDLQTPDSAIIDLGAVAELLVDNWRCMGLIARTTLTQDEAEMLSGIPRELLTSGTKGPFEYLEKRFDAAWTCEPGTGIAYLREHHQHSLVVTAPNELNIKKPDGEIDEMWVHTLMIEALNEVEPRLVSTVSRDYVTEHEERDAA